MEGIEFQSINAINYWANQFYLYLPKLGLGFLVLIIGVLISKGLGKIVSGLLAKLGVDKATAKTGITDMVKGVGIEKSVSDIIGELVKYMGCLVSLMVSFDIFGLQVITGVLNTIINYMPKIIGAVTILVVGFIIAGFIAEVIKRTVKGAGADKVAQNVGISISIGEAAETLVRYFLYTAVVLIALKTLQVSTDILAWLFTTITAAVVIAGALVLVVSLRDIGPSIITGMFVKTEKALKKGDIISFKGQTGKVISTGIVYTTVRTKKGILQIPNKLLAEHEFGRK